MKIEPTPLIEEQEIVAEKDLSDKDIMELLFEDDGTTPKIDTKDLSSLFKGLPKASPEITVIIQNLSVIPSRALGPHWYMAPEQAQFICSAALQVLADQGYKVGKIKSEYILLAAIGAYLIPNLIIQIMEMFIKPKEIDPNIPSQPTATATATPTTHAAQVERQFDEFSQKYGDSLNEDGTDKYSDQRTIKKP